MAPHRVPRALLQSFVDSPLGRLRLLSLDDALCYLGFDAEEEGTEYSAWVKRYLSQWTPVPAGGAHEAIHEQLRRYFNGNLKRFRVRSQLFGTDFQLQVWTALRAIAYGTTCSYSTVAEAIGNPHASRAVGQAVGRNPISIIIPCHRVLGEDGSLIGYGGGIDRKKHLLRIEGALLV
jgi:methylated-DNA-[protein]-cysteine S-methyltransferase